MPVQETGLGFVQLAPTRNPFNYDWFEQTNRNVSTGWLTLAEIREQLNLYSDTSQDTYLTSLELAIRMAIEDYLGSPIVSVQYKSYYGASALYGSPLSLDLPQTSQGGVTINSVQYYNDATPTVLTTVSPSNYYYDPTGRKVICTDLPTSINPQMTSPVIVTYTLTASPFATYPIVKQAGLLWFTHLYNNRSAVGSTVGQLAQIPMGVDTLLRPYKPLVM
jgi:hypothetical protein